jgi:surfeit locus 1 family protein
MHCFQCGLLTRLSTPSAQTKTRVFSRFESLPISRSQAHLLQFRRLQHSRQPESSNPADNDPNWVSLADRDPVYMRSRRKHGPGIIVLALIPLTAFALGTWQIKRLQWKTDLIARLEDQLVRPPLPLPPRIDLEQIPSFDHRRVSVTGRYRHDQEMLIGPRMRDGVEGYHVITPFERGPDDDKVLISRGWIDKGMKDHKKRGEGSLPQGEIELEGLLREPFKKNSFTPDNAPDKNEYYFPDVLQMAELAGAKPIWIEEIMEPEFFEILRRTKEGVPIGRSASVQLHNSHAQYIVTW